VTLPNPPAVDVAAVRATLEKCASTFSENRDYIRLAIAALDQQQREIERLTDYMEGLNDQAMAETQRANRAEADLAAAKAAGDLGQTMLNEEIGAHNRAKAAQAQAREILRRIATGDFHYMRTVQEVAATALGTTVETLAAGPMRPDAEVEAEHKP
jgi:hypothetical protein